MLVCCVCIRQNHQSVPAIQSSESCSAFVLTYVSVLFADEKETSKYPGIQSYYTAFVLGLTYVRVLCLGEDQFSEHSYKQSYTDYVLYYVISELPADEHPAMQLCIHVQIMFFLMLVCCLQLRTNLHRIQPCNLTIYDQLCADEKL